MILPLPRRDHVLAEFPAEHELGVQVHLDHLVPVLVRMLGGGAPENRAGVVDQDVDRGHVGFDLFDEGVERCRSAKSHCVAAEGSPQRVTSFSTSLPEVSSDARDADDIRPGLGQSHGHRLADAAFAAGDQCRPPTQIKFAQNAHSHSPRLCLLTLPIPRSVLCCDRQNCRQKFLPTNRPDSTWIAAHLRPSNTGLYPEFLQREEKPLLPISRVPASRATPSLNTTTSATGIGPRRLLPSCKKVC